MLSHTRSSRGGEACWPPNRRQPRVSGEQRLLVHEVVLAPEQPRPAQHPRVGLLHQVFGILAAPAQTVGGPVQPVEMPAYRQAARALRIKQGTIIWPISAAIRLSPRYCCGCCATRPLPRAQCPAIWRRSSSSAAPRHLEQSVDQLLGGAGTGPGGEDSRTVCFRLSDG
jgi:hypothetical protein